MDDSPLASLFRIEGEYWTIVFDGQTVRMRDTTGLHFIAYLLAHPTVRVPSTDLVAGSRSALASTGHAAEVASTVDPSDRERARVTVAKGITAALRRIAGAHPSLARHLEVTIKRGYACSYNPDPRVPIAWEVMPTDDLPDRIPLDATSRGVGFTRNPAAGEGRRRCR